MPRSKGAAKGPHIIKRHIRGDVRFVVDLGMVQGKRVERFFRTRELAEEHLAEQKGKLILFGHSAVALSETDRVRFQSARDRLAAAGANIDKAVDYYLEHHRPLREPITIMEAIAKCVLDKELAGARKRYLQTFACSCRSFLPANGNYSST